jgi:hypothetical protein
MGVTVYPNVTNYLLEVAQGNVGGVAHVNKFGQNTAVGTSSTETVWDGSNLYTFPATADITHIRQPTDQATMRGETIEVQGALKRVFRMKVLANVVTTQNVELRNVGGGTTYALITAGNNQTLMAFYTVPASKTAYITNYYATVNQDTNGTAPDVITRMWFQDNQNSYKPQLKHVRGLDATGGAHFQHHFEPYYSAGQKTDIYLTAQNLSGSTAANVSAGFDLILVDN